MSSQRPQLHHTTQTAPSMWRINLQSPPSRPPPPFDPLIEAWLDSLPPPTAKPSMKELKQWRLNDYHGLGRSVFVTCIILRTISFAIAVSVTSIIVSVVAERHGPFYVVERLVPLLAVCPVVALWNIAEFVAACVLQDGGIPPKIHVVADGIFFVGVAISMGILLVDVICGLIDFPSTFSTAAQEISSACLLIVLMVIHSFLLFSFICSYANSKRRKPRQAVGQLAPQHAHMAAFWRDDRYSTDKAEPPATPPPLKLRHITATVELQEFDQKPRYESPGFGISMHQTTSPERPPAVALENAMLAQAISGLWDLGAESPYNARPPRRYYEAIGSEVGQKPATMGQCL